MGLCVKVIKTLRSRRYAVVFIILIIISLVLATAIPQRSRMTEAEWFRLRTKHPHLVRIIKTTGLDHVYTSWWFLAIAGLFSINIGLNLTERIKVSWRQFNDERDLSASRIEALPLNTRISLSVARDFLSGQIEGILKQSGYRVKGYGKGLFAIKGRIGYWWVPLFHGGILLVLIGVLISGLFRFSGTLEISEGQVFHGREGEYINRWYGLTGYRPEMDFSVKLMGFNAEYWNGRHPKLYQSIVEIKTKDGRIFTKTIEINTPFRYSGYSLYQTKYWGYSAVFGLKRGDSGSEETGYVNLPYKTDYRDKTLRQDFVIPGAGFHAFLEYKPSGNKVYVEIKDGVKPIYRGALNKGSKINLKGYTLSFQDMVKWTGLYISCDPGVWVVYTGFTVLVISSLGMVFIYPRRLWVWINGDFIMVGAEAGRRKEEFRGEYGRIVEKIKGVVT